MNNKVDVIKCFLDGVKNNPNKPSYDFLDFQNEEPIHHYVSRKECYDNAILIKNQLMKLGGKKQDRAIIICMQDEGTVNAIWGCMMAGVVFTLVPPPTDKEKINRFVSTIKSCHPKFLISNKKLEKESKVNINLSIIKDAFFDVFSLKRIWTDEIPKNESNIDYSIIPHDKDDLVYIQYTSGSINNPKGVMITYDNMESCISMCNELYGFINSENKLVSWVPFYHNIGLIVSIFLTIFSSANGLSYFIPTLKFLSNPKIWLKTISALGANITVAPNSSYEMCTKIYDEKEAKELDISSLELIINGSEFVDSETISKFSKLFNIKKDAFAPGYGLSECVCIGSLSYQDYKQVNLDYDAYLEGKFVIKEDGKKTVVSLGKTGKDLLALTVKDGKECKEDEIGEIYLKGDSVSKGYWRNPEESKVFSKKVEGYDGYFFATGDMGKVYNGEIYLTGRIKEMINISGKNYFPSDIALVISNANLNINTTGIAAFSFQKDGEEKAVLCAEAKEKADLLSLSKKIDKVMYDTFNFSFDDIVFVENNTLPRTSNNKLKTLQIKELYEKGTLENILFVKNDDNIKDNVEGDSISYIINENTKKEGIYDVLKSLLKSVMNIDSIDIHDNILQYGGNSLNMIVLINKIERIIEKKVEYKKVMQDSTIFGISRYIYALLHNQEYDASVDLQQDAQLPEDLTIEKAYTKKINETENIFLTGASGFLGAHLIESLISEKPNIKIYALVRAKDEKSALEKIIKNSKKLRRWKTGFKKHIIPILGDLDKENLGIDKNTYNMLSNNIDMIIHNGAKLNFSLPYKLLKKTNVDATLESIKLAFSGRPKYFNYISSYSVYDNFSHFKTIAKEDDDLVSYKGYLLGYEETKWVSEKMVKEAIKRGLKATIYRPGDITGTYKDGIWKMEDLLSRSIVGCIQMGYAPDVDMKLHFTPVDYVAKCVSHICFKEDAINHAFNVINNSILPLKEIVNSIRNIGYTLILLPFDSWCEKLTSTSSEENSLRVLSFLFTDGDIEDENIASRFGKNQATFDISNTKKLISDTNIVCQSVDKHMIKKYLQNFYRMNYIKGPKGLIKRLLFI